MKAVNQATDIRKNEALTVTAERFQRLFNSMSSGNIGRLDEVYAKDAVFIDPMVRIQGADALRRHFEKVYANVASCRFDFEPSLYGDQDICMPWVMTLHHPKLRRGKQVLVDGMSRLTVHEGRVTLHRDYYDAGQMLYENVPALGSLIRMIRNYAS